MIIIHIRFSLYNKLNIKFSKLTTIKVSEPINAGRLRGGDKHSVVNSDRNSSKHNNVNIGCKGITSIISRYFRTAGTPLST